MVRFICILPLSVRKPVLNFKFHYGKIHMMKHHVKKDIAAAFKFHYGKIHIALNGDENTPFDDFKFHYGKIHMKKECGNLLAENL